MQVKDQSEKSGGIGGEDPRVGIAQLRKHVTEYLRSCELLLMQSPHKKVNDKIWLDNFDRDRFEENLVSEQEAKLFYM